jgi:hypothetical protein
MKLIDLQTRKYLQSNEDWLDGNNYIYIIQSDNDNDNDNEAEEYVDGDTISAKMYKRSTPEGILQDICSKTGAYLYGGRYLLERNYICEYEIIYSITRPDYIHAELPRNFEHTPLICCDVEKSNAQYFSNKFICKQTDYLRAIKKFHKIDQYDESIKIEVLQVTNLGIVNILGEYFNVINNDYIKLEELLKKII